MKRQKFMNSGLALAAIFLFSGCYTQLHTIHEQRIVDRRPAKAVETVSDNAYNAPRQTASQPDTERVITASDEESYLEGYEHGVEDGYEDGWTDAESYYFKDYEAAEFYRENNAILGYRDADVVYVDNYYGHGYSPYVLSGFHTPFYHHSGFYHPFAFHHYPRSSFHFGFNFGHGFGHHNPYYGGHFYPYGSFFAFGFHGSFHHGSFFNHGHGGFIHSGSNVGRTRTVRSSGLSSRGTTRSTRVRNDARTNGRTSGTRINSRERSVNSSDVGVRSRSGRTGLTRSQARINDKGRVNTIRSRTTGTTTTIRSRANTIRSRSSVRTRSRTLRSNLRTRISNSSRSGRAFRSSSRSSSGRSAVRSSSRSSSSRGTIKRSRSSSSRGSIKRSSRSSSSRGAVKRSSRSSSSKGSRSRGSSRSRGNK